MRQFFEFAGSTRTLVLTFVVTAVILFLAFPNLPINGELLDQKMGYSYAEATDAFEAYGDDGRAMYLWISLLLDTLFPIVYVTFFGGLIYRFRATEGTWWLACVPILGGVCDLLENAQISAMLLAYPDISESQVAWASSFTQVKHWIGSLYLVISVLLLLTFVMRTVVAKIRASGTRS